MTRPMYTYRQGSPKLVQLIYLDFQKWNINKCHSPSKTLNWYILIVKKYYSLIKIRHEEGKKNRKTAMTEQHQTIFLMPKTL